MATLQQKWHIDTGAPVTAQPVVKDGVLYVGSSKGRFYAIDNLCPHRGGPLGEGDIEGAIVVCPWHGWRWDVTTGANANNPAVRVSCYAVTVEQGAVFVALG